MIVLSVVAWYSGCRSVGAVFSQVFILFAAVNLYDLIVLDWGIFCHSQKIRIPGTEDMDKEYRNLGFHVKAAAIGFALGAAVALLCGGVVHLASAI